MRTALDQALGQPPPPGYNPDLAQFQPILAVHIQELRNRVVAAWNAPPVQIPVDGHANLSYDNATNRITTAGFAYDAAGNQVRALASGGVSQRFQYDAANRLVTVRTDASVIIASYSYGASNERLIREEAGVRTYHACNGSAEYTETGSSITPQWSKYYIYLGARLLSTLTPNGPTGHFVQYHHPDRLGTRLVTNAQDTTYFEQQTLPFGTALNESPPAGGTTNATNRRFTTYDRSLNTGLDYAVNRHYDAQQGRFTQVDPIGMRSTDLSSPQTLNLYAYCTNDPINHTDPSGLGFFGFLKNLFKKVVNAIKAAVVAFVVAFVGSGGDFKKARRAATRAFVSSFGFETRVWRPTGTAPTFPTGSGGPALHQIFQGTILSVLFPSPQSYLRFVNGFAGGTILGQLQAADVTTALDTCTKRIFGVALSAFVPSSRGANGSFTGIPRGGSPTNPITVLNDVRSYSRRGLRRLVKRFNGRDGGAVAGAFVPPSILSEDLARSIDTGFSAYRNYTARDLQGSAYVFLIVQIHELGNSLQNITGASVFPSLNSTDPDAGQVLEECFRNEYAK
jgi:RHS repeat-associated protein